jgi:hypothetical protein
MTLYIKLGRRYVPASPGQVLAATVQMLHKHGLARIANELTQRVMDHNLMALLPERNTKDEAEV